jgi:alkyl hydroperoxide reductase subunit AhpC
MLKVGQTAPDFELPDADMEMIGLRDFHGRKNLVLYFYPKDGTPSCTRRPSISVNWKSNSTSTIRSCLAYRATTA